MLTREGQLITFSAWHPETGEVSPGAKMNQEQGEAFGMLFMQKMMIIHSQDELSRTEAVFVENTVQHTSSIIRYLFEDKRYDPPKDGTLLANLTDRAIELVAYADPNVLDAEEWPDSEVQATVKATALVAGSVISVSQVPEIRQLSEGYAVVAAHILATMLRENDGVEIDQYLLEQMQNLIVAYETIDKK